MPKRILLIANEYTTIINFRMELIHAFIKAGHTVGVALPDHERNAEIRAIECMTYSLPIKRKSKNPIKDFKIVYKIFKIIDEFHPDIAFTFTIKPNVYGGIACTMKHIPYVATITGLGTSIQNGGLMQKVSLFLYKFGLKNAQKVFFQNTSNRDFLIQTHTYEGKYEVVPGSGVNLSRFHVMNYPSNEELNFVYVGRVMKEKGIEEFFEAATYIHGKYPYVYFHVCGPCEDVYEERLRELERRGIVIYYGRVKDMTTKYVIAHCIVHPSYHEGMANVLLEAAACGKAIIASDIAGCREVVDDGVNGFLVDVKNADSLKENIEKFIFLSYEQQKQMGLAGRKKVEKEFDRNIVIGMYLGEL